MLSHRNIIFQVGAFKRIGLPLGETDEALNFLPLCHVAERFGGCYNHIAAMHIVNFAEAPDTVPQNLREVAPHIFLAVPRVWEKLYSAVTIQIKEGTALGRLAYKWAIAHRLQGQRLRGRGQAGAGALGIRPRHRQPARAEEHSRAPGARPHPLGGHRGGADLARPDRLVLGDGREDVRALWADRKRRTGHLQLPGPPQGRHHRPDGAGHRAQAFRAGRDPAARTSHLQRLPQQAREDGRGAAGRLAPHRRRRASSTIRASCASPTA